MVSTVLKYFGITNYPPNKYLTIKQLLFLGTFRFYSNTVRGSFTGNQVLVF